MLRLSGVYCDVSVSSVAANAEQQLLVECVCENVRREGRTNSAGVSQTIVCVCCLVSSLAIKCNKYSL